VATKYSAAIQEIMNECEAEKTTIQGDYNKLLEDLKDVIRDSVRSRCCSYDDVWSGVTKNWDIVDNEITCSGNYTVRCDTGETDY